MQDKAAKILEEAAKLKIAKSKDYQNGMWKESDYFPFGDTSYLHMLWTKMLRIRSVAESKETNFESLEDSLLDMINYSAMYISYLRDKDSGESTLLNNNNLSEADMLKAKQLWDLQRKI